VAVQEVGKLLGAVQVVEAAVREGALAGGRGGGVVGEQVQG